jgi:hypothetical protein
MKTKNVLKIMFSSKKYMKHLIKEFTNGR